MTTPPTNEPARVHTPPIVTLEYQTIKHPRLMKEIAPGGAGGYHHKEATDSEWNLEVQKDESSVSTDNSSFSSNASEDEPEVIEKDGEDLKQTQNNPPTSIV